MVLLVVFSSEMEACGGRKLSWKSSEFVAVVGATSAWLQRGLEWDA